MNERHLNRAQRRQLAHMYRAPTSAFEHAKGGQESVKQLYELAECAANGDLSDIRFAKQAFKLFGREIYDASEFESFSRNLFQHYIKGRSMVDALASLYYLSIILMNIRSIHAQRCEQSNTPHAKYHLFPIQALALTTAQHYFHQFTPADQRRLSWLTDRIDAPELKKVFENIDNYFTDLNSVCSVADAMERTMRDELDITPSDARELQEMSDQLFSELMRLQQYTIRQSLFDDQMKLPYTERWVVSDPHQIRPVENIGSLEFKLVMKFHECVAEFLSVRAGQDIRDLSMCVTREELELRITLPFTASLNLVFKLQSDGELYYQVYPVAVCWRDVFKKIGMEHVYEFLRFQFIARFFDLVVPREISEQTPSMDGLKERFCHARSSQGEVKATRTLRDLITPRIRMLRDKKKIQEAQQRELDDANAKTKREFFGRVGHPMRLRQGYRPHSDAKKWAKEDGLLRELEDNETWCRPVDSPMPVAHRQKERKS